MVKFYRIDRNEKGDIIKLLFSPIKSSYNYVIVKLFIAIKFILRNDLENKIVKFK